MSLPRSSILAFRASLSVALVVIMYLAVTPQTYPVVESLNDKVIHLLAFCMLALLGDYSSPADEFGIRKFLLLSSYGLLIEFVQYFLPYREASLLDLMADCLGLSVYWVLYGHLKHLPILRLRWRTFSQA